RGTPLRGAADYGTHREPTGLALKANATNGRKRVPRRSAGVVFCPPSLSCVWIVALLVGGSCSAAAGQDVPAPGRPDPGAGQAVAVGTFNAGPTGACFQCHGQGGEGDAAAAFPRLSGQSYGYLVKALKDYASGARQNEIMSPIAEALSEQEMRDVSAYY